MSLAHSARFRAGNHGGVFSRSVAHITITSSRPSGWDARLRRAPLMIGVSAMKPIEMDILNWYAEHYPSAEEAIRSQIKHAQVKEREFTSGGGVFINFEVMETAIPVRTKELLSHTQIEGPFIKSPDLEHDASAGLGLTPEGFFECLEIWAHANDYPSNHHPEVYELAMPKVNYVDLR